MYIGSLGEGSLLKGLKYTGLEHKIPFKEIYPDWE
jgi:hypothetical protein